MPVTTEQIIKLLTERPERPIKLRELLIQKGLVKPEPAILVDNVCVPAAAVALFYHACDLQNIKPEIILRAVETILSAKKWTWMLLEGEHFNLEQEMLSFLVEKMVPQNPEQAIAGLTMLADAGSLSAQLTLVTLFGKQGDKIAEKLEAFNFGNIPGYGYVLVGGVPGSRDVHIVPDVERARHYMEMASHHPMVTPFGSERLKQIEDDCSLSQTTSVSP